MFGQLDKGIPTPTYIFMETHTLIVSIFSSSSEPVYYSQRVITYPLSGEDWNYNFCFFQTYWMRLVKVTEKTWQLWFSSEVKKWLITEKNCVKMCDLNRSFKPAHCTYGRIQGYLKNEEQMPPRIDSVNAQTDQRLYLLKSS